MSCHCPSTSSLIKKLPPPASATLIYKDECVLCFRKSSDEHGLDLCLECFEGFCPDEHSTKHLLKCGHRTAMNVRAKISENNTSPKHLTKIEVVEHEDICNVADSLAYHFKCLECGLPVEQVSNEKLKEAILNSSSAKYRSRKQQRQSASVLPVASSVWTDQPLSNCLHFLPVCSSTPEVSLQKATCHCGLTENLWMCLSCGHIACGRAQWDGTGGKGHAREHFNAFPEDHAVALKLGTVEAMDVSGDQLVAADLFCYRCDEMVAPPDWKSLARLLKCFFGPFPSYVKYEQSMNELTLAQNEQFEFSMRDSQGHDYSPAHGPGCLAIKNMGNTCYMASILQACFSLPQFTKEVTRINQDSHFISCALEPPVCVICQLYKLINEWARGTESTSIEPWMFKAALVVSKPHSPFASAQQQDAAEFFEFMFVNNPGIVHDNVLFTLVTQQTLTCSNCNFVKHSKPQSNLTTLLNLTGILTQYAGDLETSFDESSQKQLTKIPIEMCLAHTFEEELVVGYKCENCGLKDTVARASNIIRDQLPMVLVLQLGRFSMSQETGKSIKLDDVQVVIPWTDNNQHNFIDLAPFCIDHNQVTTERNPSSNFNDSLLTHLQEFGFGPGQAMLTAIHFKDEKDLNSILVQTAIDWLISSGIQEEDIQLLMAKADGTLDLEDACSALLCSNGNIQTAINNAKRLKQDNHHQNSHSRSSSTLYSLRAFVSHRGPSTACGHYVAHVLNKDNRWIMCNDDKLGYVDDLAQIAQAASESYLLFFEQQQR